MQQYEEVQALACVPVDTSILPDLGVSLPPVTDLYVQEICEACDLSVWVGPRQAIARELSSIRVLTLCYFCAARLYRESAGAALVDLGGGAGVEGEPAPKIDTCQIDGFFDLAKEDFPFTITFVRDDTGEVLWQQMVDGPGALQVPGFGGQGFRVDVRIEYPNGRTETVRASELT